MLNIGAQDMISAHYGPVWLHAAENIGIRGKINSNKRLFTKRGGVGGGGDLNSPRI